MKVLIQRCLWVLLLGSAWSMAAEPLRVVTAGASVTAIVQELGLAEQLVGIDSTSVSLMAERGLPNVGYQRALSAEGVLSLKPDVLLGTQEMGPPPVLAQLRDAGVDVVMLSASPDLRTLYANIEAVGVRFAQVEQAAALNQRIQADIAALPAMSEPAPPALFVLTHSASGMLVAGAGTVGDSLIHLGGMSNPAADSFSQYRVLSAEALLGLAPQWILTTSKGLDMVGGTDGLLSQQPALAATPAGQAQQVVDIEDSLLVGGLSPHIAPALRQLRETAAGE
ncbi:heme/hemin ABC transporter substrate-binding protein [Halopseudomonas maritima]|uniref:heme/hemin ABC transporter substrate-binding protein n=1 Tax=Halopseudomonas maritima TaxID=2918528 RepID=UPI001EECC15E|nr:ABC transporter substrate-binding protein [Halopseudomonas maritima]UJJ30470.1 ABC transporter substrate-binding protein [Halopseudomonas maritima]